MTTADIPHARRRAGVLLHPTSLPGGEGVGDLGDDAYRFIEFLAASGMTVWQMLPLVPTHGDLSPYQGLSVYAGNPLLISLARLQAWGWLRHMPQHDPADFFQFRRDALRTAYQGFLEVAGENDKAAFKNFASKEAAWLDDYALFQALRQTHGYQHWLMWPEKLRDRDRSALAQSSKALSEVIDFVRFEQFVFFRQWFQLREYARQHGILLFGDMPIFVAHDSAEVWAHREYFTLDEHGRALTVAGVPPDYFSETGQRWGNPHYCWDRMEEDGFRWWRARLGAKLKMFDWVRIDHFRGFEAYWEIDAEEKTAINGRWVKAPGDRLFQALQESFDSLPLVAEDLGVITEEVNVLRQKYKLPGMKILQFAFGGDADNPYLPHHHTTDSIVYTGTHDNDTTLGWFQSADKKTQHHVREYFGHPREPMPWPMIRAAMASVSQMAIVPMQDLLALGSDHRMNMPGTMVEGNWRWRFDWQQVPPDLAQDLKQLITLYDRYPLSLS